MTPDQLREWAASYEANGNHDMAEQCTGYAAALEEIERLKVHAEESHSLLIRAMAYTPTDCSLFDDMHKRLKAYRAEFKDGEK